MSSDNQNNNQLWIIPIFVALIGAYGVSVQPKQITSGKTICDPLGEIPVDSNKYLIRNNVWHPSAGKQCIEITNLPNKPGFKVISTSHSAVEGVVNSYPSIVKGCRPWGGECTQGWTSMRLQDIDAANSIFAIGGTDALGTWNAAYDLWIDSSTNPQNGPSSKGVELMIWTQSKGGIRPGGTKIGETRLKEKIDGKWQQVEYEVYHATPWPPPPGNQWKHYVAYKRKNQTDKVEIDLKSAIADCVKQRWCDPKAYLLAIEAGFEIGVGGVGLKTETFSASVQAQQSSQQTQTR